MLPGNGAILTDHFRASLKHKKRRSNKIYKNRTHKDKIQNRVMCKYCVDPHRARLTLITELTWSNLAIKRVLNKRK